VKLQLFFLLFALAFVLVWSYTPAMRGWQHVGFVRIAADAGIALVLIPLLMLIYKGRRKK